MRNNFLIFLGIVGVIGAALFGDRIVALFAGMTPLDALRMIATFILHVAVATILSFAVFTAPDLLKPWTRALRRKRKSARRQPPPVATPRAPRVNNAALLRWMLTQQSQPKPKQLPMISSGDDQTRLNF